jgi:NAD+ synthetase
VLEFRGLRITLPICEDLWNDRSFWRRRRYAVDPVAECVEKGGVELIVSISASPFCVGRPRFRQHMLANTCRRHGVGLVYVNLVGGNTHLIFDGSSLALDAQGRVVAAGASFAEDFVVVDTDAGPASTDSGPAARYAPGADGDAQDVEDAFRALVLGTRDYLHKSGFRHAVVGLSGGVDSALTAVIAAEALGPENVTGVAMPSRYSSEGSVRDAEKLARALGIRLHKLSIEKIFTAALETLAPVFAGRGPDVTEENIQARIRGLLLMAFSNKFGSLLLTTGNKSELAVGYCTLYGDMSGGLAVISDVPKTLVYRIARWLNREREVVPWESIRKPPSAELRPGQTDQDSLPPYEVLDAILERYVEDGKGLDEIVAEGFDRELVREVLRKVDANEYKRKQAAPGLRITSKAFGHGRRFPIVKRLKR